MARVALTTAWTALDTTITGGFVQNIGPNPVLLAYAAAEPAAGAEVGFILQAEDYAPLTGIASSNLYARTTSGVSDVEVLIIDAA